MLSTCVTEHGIPTVQSIPGVRGVGLIIPQVYYGRYTNSYPSGQILPHDIGIVNSYTQE